MEKKNKISVVIVDDHSIIAEGVRQLAGKTEDIELIGSATGPDELIKILNKKRADLAIVDIELKSVSGIDLIKGILRRFPRIRVLVMSMYDELIYGERAIKSGAVGYIMKEEASRNLMDAIRTIMTNGFYASEELQKLIVGKVLIKAGGSKNFLFDSLSDREFEIFRLLGNGFNTRDISNKLSISVNTIETHRKRIKEKLKMPSSAELKRQAIQWVITSSQSRTLRR